MSILLTKPVWTWLAGEPRPVRCGTFAWQVGRGEFSYEREYMALDGAMPLDPVSLPFSRSIRPCRESKQKGLFGVLRDASPDGYGLAWLEERAARELSPLESLESAPGDSVGAIEVCDDIRGKADFKPTPLEVLLTTLADMPAGAPVAQALGRLAGAGLTALGGDRPKLTVTHRGQHWIAKLQDRSNGPNSPLREFLAMRAARACGVDAAEVELKRTGMHQVLLVRRFDRLVRRDGQVLRYGFASAHTMLRLDSAATRGDAGRTYPKLADVLERWGGVGGAAANEVRRELWRRLAFNVIVGNGDDHPRNHGVLQTGGRWSLSPAFDIAPRIAFLGSLAMGITRDGHDQASRWALLRAAPTFGYDQVEAASHINRAVETMKRSWEAERSAQGFTADDAPTPAPEPWLHAQPPAGFAPGRRSSLGLPVESGD